MNKPGKRCSRGTPNPPPNPLRCLLSTGLGTCMALGRPHQGLPAWFSHGVFLLIWLWRLGCCAFFLFSFDRWNEQYTLLLSIFSTLPVIDKSSLEKCILEKGRGCLQGPEVSPGAEHRSRPARPAGSQPGGQNNSTGKALNNNFFTEDERPLRTFVWLSHSSRGD